VWDLNGSLEWITQNKLRSKKYWHLSCQVEDRFISKPIEGGGYYLNTGTAIDYDYENIRQLKLLKALLGRFQGDSAIEIRIFVPLGKCSRNLWN
jgi:hypothetical protein